MCLALGFAKYDKQKIVVDCAVSFSCANFLDDEWKQFKFFVSIFLNKLTKFVRTSINTFYLLKHIK